MFVEIYVYIHVQLFRVFQVSNFSIRKVGVVFVKLWVLNRLIIIIIIGIIIIEQSFRVIIEIIIQVSVWLAVKILGIKTT